jgi:hypothetical protein
MSKYFSTAITLIVTFFVSLTLNTLASYFGSDNGIISISRPLTVGENNITVLSIENYSSKFIDGIILEIPLGISAANISSDSAVKIADIAPATTQRAGSVKISQISPRHTTAIVVAGTKSSEPNSVRILNASESGLTLQKDDQLQSLLDQALRMAMAASIIQAMLVAVGAYYTSQQREELKKDIEKIHGNLDKLRQESRDIRAYSTKVKILLLGRISDYARELEFWRNFIKENIGSEFVKNRGAEKIFEHVRKSLKTYGTRSTEPDLDAIKIAAGWLRDGERKFDQQEEA